MASVTELREAIKTVLAVELPEVTVYATAVLDANLPAIVVRPAPELAEFPLQTGQANDVWQFDLIVMTSFGEASVGQGQLDKYLSGEGSTSIRQIFMRHPHLDRADVTIAYVSGISEYGSGYNMASVDNIGCRVRLTVKTTGPAWS
jgi:hypothetical protein